MLLNILHHPHAHTKPLANTQPILYASIIHNHAPL